MNSSPSVALFPQRIRVAAVPGRAVFGRAASLGKALADAQVRRDMSAWQAGAWLQHHRRPRDLWESLLDLGEN
jgi:hypothetical protein